MGSKTKKQNKIFLLIMALVLIIPIAFALSAGYFRVSTLCLSGDCRTAWPSVAGGFDGNASSICDSNTVLTGDGSCLTVTGFDVDTDTTIPDTNAETICADANSALTGSGVCVSLSGFHIDTTGGSGGFDGNASSICDSNTVLTGDGTCLSVTGFDVDTDTTIPDTDTNAQTACIDANSALTGNGSCVSLSNFHVDTDTTLNEADLNLMYCQVIDSNNVGRLDYQVIANPIWITNYLDTNAENICADANSALTGDGSCVSLSNFHVDTDTTIPDTNSMTACDGDSNSVLNSVGDCVALSNFHIDTTGEVSGGFDGNASSICDGNTALTGDGTCVSIANFHIDTDTITTDTTIDTNSSAFTSVQADLNLMYCQLIDINVSHQTYTTIPDAPWITNYLDTNAENICDGNTALTGDGTCVSLSGFHIDTTGEVSGGFDGNASSICDGNTALTGEGVCIPITGFHIQGVGSGLSEEDGNAMYLRRGTTDAQDIDANITFNAEVTANNDCGIPFAVLIFSEGSAIDNTQWDVGSAFAIELGQACSGRVLAVSAFCTTAGSSLPIQPTLNGTPIGDLLYLATNSDVNSLSYNYRFSKHDKIGIESEDEVGTWNNCTGIVYVVYD